MLECSKLQQSWSKDSRYNIEIKTSYIIWLNLDQQKTDWCTWWQQGHSEPFLQEKMWVTQIKEQEDYFQALLGKINAAWKYHWN